MSAEPRESVQAALGLDALRLNVVLPPRIARRLRILANQEHREPEALAARLLARTLVPDRFERRRMVRADLRDAGIER